jgi:hypothetical protein
MRPSILVWSALLASAAQAQDVSDAGTPLDVVTPKTLPARPALAVETPTARDRLLGTWGFGFLGTEQVLLAATGAGSNGERIEYSSVPVLGVRWWTPWRRLGLEAGLGAMVSTAHATTGTNVVANGPSSFELLAHVSAPLVISSTTNTILFVAPEARVGLSWIDSGGIGAGVVTATTLHFNVKAGLEIFFTFLGLPNLSLEAGVRAGLAHEVRNYWVNTATSSLLVSTQLTRFSTSLVANPWDLFTGSLAARYYF